MYVYSYEKLLTDILKKMLLKYLLISKRSGSAHVKNTRRMSISNQPICTTLDILFILKAAVDCTFICEYKKKHIRESLLFYLLTEHKNIDIIKMNNILTLNINPCGINASFFFH